MYLHLIAVSYTPSHAEETDSVPQGLHLQTCQVAGMSQWEVERIAQALVLSFWDFIAGYPSCYPYNFGQDIYCLWFFRKIKTTAFTQRLWGLHEIACKAPTKGPGISRCWLAVNFPPLLPFLLLSVLIYLSWNQLMIYSCCLDYEKKNVKKKKKNRTCWAYLMLCTTQLVYTSTSPAGVGKSCSGPSPIGPGTIDSPKMHYTNK